jgi:hypothetical protein
VHEQFRRWLAAYAQMHGQTDYYEAAMQDLPGNRKVYCKLSRESMNER